MCSVVSPPPPPRSTTPTRHQLLLADVVADSRLEHLLAYFTHNARARAGESGLTSVVLVVHTQTVPQRHSLTTPTLHLLLLLLLHTVVYHTRNMPTKPPLGMYSLFMHFPILVAFIWIPVLQWDNSYIAVTNEWIGD